MCIISVSAAGTARPDSATLATMWRNNSDGAGIMWVSGGLVHCRKGLMTLDALAAAIAAVPANAPLAIHCRIGTSGGINPAMTHPFPIAGDADTLKALTWSGPAAAMHNGILHGLGDKALSDTAQYVQRVLYPLFRAIPDAIHSDTVESVVNTTITGSRFVVFTATGDIKLYGDGWQNDGGIWYSNATYKEARYKFDSWAKWPSTARSISPTYSYDYDYDYDQTPGRDDSDTLYDVFPLYGTDTMILNDVGELEDPDDYGVDPDGLVWLYDPETTDGGPWWIPCDGYTVLSADGSPVSYTKVVARWDV